MVTHTPLLFNLEQLVLFFNEALIDSSRKKERGFYLTQIVGTAQHADDRNQVHGHDCEVIFSPGLSHWLVSNQNLVLTVQ